MMATLQGNSACEITCVVPPGCVNALVPVCVRLSTLHPSTCPTKAWRRTVCAGQTATYSLEADANGISSGTPLSGLYTDYDQLAMNDCRCVGSGGASTPATPTVAGRQVATACNAAGQTVLLQYGFFLSQNE